MSPPLPRTPRRIEAHVKVCVLSLLIDRVAEHRFVKLQTRNPKSGI